MTPDVGQIVGDGEYEVSILSLRTGINHRVDWSNIKWGRKRNDISEATIATNQIDGPAFDRSTELVRALEAWHCALTIERNGSKVWSGPVTGFGRDDSRPGAEGAISIRARDRMAITKKRPIGTDRTFTSASISDTIFPTIVADAFEARPSYYSFVVPAGGWPTVGGRAYVEAMGENLWTCIEELSERGLTWTFVGDTLVCDLATLTAASARVGLMTDRAFVALPAVDVEGLEQADDWLILAGPADTGGFTTVGTASGANPILGALTSVEQRDDLTTQTDADAYAAEQRARFQYPTIAVTKATLSPFAPIAFDDLIPGINVQLSFDESSMLGAADAYGAPTYGIDAVDVEVSSGDEGTAERVTLAFGPPTAGI